MIIGNRISELRKEQGLTQRQLADKVGIERSSLAHIERGTWYPSAEKMRLISDALQKPLGEIFFNPSVLGSSTKQKKGKVV